MVARVKRVPQRRAQSGMTLVELVVVITIMTILSLVILPLNRNTARRYKEKELRADLQMMRDAIDRYKEVTDRGLIKIKLGSDGYPPTLETLVEGVEVNGQRIKFLRAIPRDPMTGAADWGLRSNQDDADSESWDGESVYDVYSTSQGTAMDGSKYKDW